LGDGVLSPGMIVTVPRSEADGSMELGWPCKSVPEPYGEQCGHMWQEDRGAVLNRAYREYWDAKEALDVLEAACVEISKSSSITSDEGYLMLSPSGVRLLETDYVRELVTQYHAARRNKEALRKRLMELGEPDPDPK
jgi:hypothetical protein